MASSKRYSVPAWTVTEDTATAGRASWQQSKRARRGSQTTEVTECDIIQAISAAEVAGVAEELEESRRLEDASTLRGRTRSFVSHRFFEQGMALVIFLNAVYIGIELDNHEDQDDDGPWRGIELAFVIIFLIEIALRLIVGRFRFFCDGWNLFDFVLVTLAAVDTCILTYVQEDSSALGVMSTVRILRIARVARIFRLLRFFKELWLLVVGVFDAIRTLVWTWLLMALVIFIAAIFITRLVGRRIDDQNALLTQYFGTVHASMFTLFQIMTTEGWVGVARETMRYEPWAWLFFIIYLVITTYAIMNVVVAVIVEKTLERALQTREDRLKKAEEECLSALAAIVSFFKKADATGAMVLTKADFLTACTRPEVVQLLSDIDVDVAKPEEAAGLFDVLDVDASGALDMDEFVEGVLNARGEARSKDVLSAQCQMWRSEERVRAQLLESSEVIDGAVELVSTEVLQMKADFAAIKELLWAPLHPPEMLQAEKPSCFVGDAPSEPTCLFPSVSPFECEGRKPLGSEVAATQLTTDEEALLNLISE